MDDRNFEDPETAIDWIQTIENESSKVRDLDIYPLLRSWIKNIFPRSVLEIGCGQGVCSDKIDLESQFIGVEPSPFLLRRAKELYSSRQRKFLRGNAYDLPVQDAQVDAVFSVSVWHLLSDLTKAASELSRVLSVNGSFLIITANPEAYSLWTENYSKTYIDGPRFEGEILKNGAILKDVLYLHPLKEILTSLEGAGLQVEKTESFRATQNDLNLFISIQGSK